MGFDCWDDLDICQTFLQDMDSAGGAPKGMLMVYASLGWHLSTGIVSLKCHGRKEMVV